MCFRNSVRQENGVPIKFHRLGQRPVEGKPTCKKIGDNSTRAEKIKKDAKSFFAYVCGRSQ